MINNIEKRNLFATIGWNPPPKQEAVNNSEAKIIIVQAPPRTLKSSTIVPEALYVFMQEKKNIWVVGIDYSTTDRFIFGKGTTEGVGTFIRKYFNWLVPRNGWHKKDHEIETLRGSIIKGKSVKYPESFVAEKVDLIVCEDASSFPDKFYFENLRPRVLDSGGRIILNSPLPMHTTNYLVRLAASGDKSLGRIEGFNWSLYDNPYLSPDEIENYIADCPPHLKRALIDGLPPTEDSTVFGKIRDKVFGGFTPFQEGHLYQAGLDIGKIHDRTVLSVSDLTVARLVFMDVFPQRFFKVDAVEARVKASLQSYGYPTCYVDISGIGSMFTDMVERNQFFLPFTIPSLKVRNMLIEELSICFQRGFSIPDLPYFLNELENLDIILKTGYHLYRSRAGYGDDTIISAALSVFGWTRRMAGQGVANVIPMVCEGLVAEDESGNSGFEPITPSYTDNPLENN